MNKGRFQWMDGQDGWKRNFNIVIMACVYQKNKPLLCKFDLKMYQINTHTVNFK